MSTRGNTIPKLNLIRLKLKAWVMKIINFGMDMVTMFEKLIRFEVDFFPSFSTLNIFWFKQFIIYQMVMYLIRIQGFAR